MPEVSVHASQRFDLFLATQKGIKSRSAAKKLIDDGRVRVNGKKDMKVSRILRAGDIVHYELPEAPVALGEDGTDLKLNILFEDDDCMVIDKPAGIAVHRGSGMDKDTVTMLDGLRFIFAKKSLPFHESEVLVHRLDKETTGCLLIAKNPEAHQFLQKQFESRSVQKIYLALVSGVPSPASAVIDAPIGRHTGDRTKMSVMQSSASRSAKTTYRTLGAADNVALLSCELHTGRTHQIRVHLRSVGHPILNDEKYETKDSLAATAKLEINFLPLHAWKLSFKSLNGKEIKAESPLQSNLKKILKELGIEIPKSNN